MPGVVVVPGDAEGELDHVQPTDVDRSGRVEPSEDGRGDIGPVTPHHRGPQLGELARPIEHVLVG